MINTRATNYFVDERFIKEKGLKAFMSPLPKLRAIAMTNKSKSRISYSIELDLVIG